MDPWCNAPSSVSCADTFSHEGRREGRRKALLLCIKYAESLRELERRSWKQYRVRRAARGLHL